MIPRETSNAHLLMVPHGVTFPRKDGIGVNHPKVSHDKGKLEEALETLLIKKLEKDATDKGGCTI